MANNASLISYLQNKADRLDLQASNLRNKPTHSMSYSARRSRISSRLSIRATLIDDSSIIVKAKLFQVKSHLETGFNKEHILHEIDDFDRFTARHHYYKTDEIIYMYKNRISESKYWPYKKLDSDLLAYLRNWHELIIESQVEKPTDVFKFSSHLKDNINTIEHYLLKTEVRKLKIEIEG